MKELNLYHKYQLRFDVIEGFGVIKGSKIIQNRDKFPREIVGQGKNIIVPSVPKNLYEPVLKEFRKILGYNSTNLNRNIELPYEAKKINELEQLAMEIVQNGFDHAHKRNPNKASKVNFMLQRDMDQDYLVFMINYASKNWDIRTIDIPTAKEIQERTIQIALGKAKPEDSRGRGFYIMAQMADVLALSIGGKEVYAIKQLGPKLKKVA